MPGPFADEQLAAYMRQQPPAFAALDVAAMREGIVQRARQHHPGPRCARFGTCLLARWALKNRTVSASD